MRRMLAVLVTMVLVTTLGGCAKASGESALATPDATAALAGAQTSSTPGAADAGAATENRSANDSELPPAPFPSFVSTSTPAVFQDRLDAGRPMVIFFYDDAQSITKDIRADIDAVMDSYRGLIDLLVFDIGGPTSDSSVQAAATYAGELSAGVTPYILVVDKSGYITWRSKGFAERGIITREVERATR